MNYLKAITFTLSLSLLGACAGMPISSVLKMRDFNPLETNPGQIRIAIITDQAATLADDAASIGIEFRSDDGKHDFSSLSTATHQLNPDIQGLQDVRDKNENITVFYLDDANAQKMRTAQSKIKAIRQQDIKGEGSLSISVKTGCFAKALPSSLEADIYLQYDDDRGFILMNKSVDLLAVDESSENENLWTVCPG